MTGTRVRIAHRGCRTARDRRKPDEGPTTSVTEDPVPLGPESRLCPVGYPDPLEELREMALHRLLADTELPRHLLVRSTAHDQLEHVALARCELDRAAILR